MAGPEAVRRKLVPQTYPRLEVSFHFKNMADIGLSMVPLPAMNGLNRRDEPTVNELYPMKSNIKQWWVAVVTRLTICALLQFSSAFAAEPFFFIQLSDPQFGMFTNNKDFVQETANFEFAVASINRLKPAFVVITGDLVNKPGDRAQIAEFHRIAAKVDPKIRVYNVVGNHDIENVPRPETISVYTNLFGPDHDSFRHGGFVGIVLNSIIIHS